MLILMTSMIVLWLGMFVSRASNWSSQSVTDFASEMFGVLPQGQRKLFWRIPLAVPGGMVTFIYRIRSTIGFGIEALT
jgi:hypothetical protein